TGYAKSRLVDAGLELAFPERHTFKEFVVRTGRDARDALQAARANGIYAGYPLGRDYPGLDDALLVAGAEKRPVAEIDPLVEALGAVSGATRSRTPGAAASPPRAPTCRCRSSQRGTAAKRRRACPSCPSPRCCATSRRSRRATSGSTPASIHSARAR